MIVICCVSVTDRWPLARRLVSWCIAVLSSSWFLLVVFVCADWCLCCVCRRVKVVQGHCRQAPPYTGAALLLRVGDESTPTRRRPGRLCRRPFRAPRTARRATRITSGVWNGSVGRRQPAKPFEATLCRLPTELLVNVHETFTTWPKCQKSWKLGCTEGGTKENRLQQSESSDAVF